MDSQSLPLDISTSLLRLPQNSALIPPRAGKIRIVTEHKKTHLLTTFKH